MNPLAGAESGSAAWQNYEISTRFGTSFARNYRYAPNDLASHRSACSGRMFVTRRGWTGLLRFIELENYLSDLLGIRVDLVMAEALKPHIGQRVLQEVLPV